MAKAYYWFDSTNVPVSSTEYIDLVSNKAGYITYESFAKVVNSADINKKAEELGYYVGRRPGLGTKLKEDPTVLYFRSLDTTSGSTVYAMKAKGVTIFFKK